jgi:hypothetical protein
MLQAPRSTWSSTVAIPTLGSVLGLFLAGSGLMRAETPGTSARALLDQYCVTCHSAKLHTAGLALDKVSLKDGVVATPEIWEKVLAKVRAGDMPPAKMPRPDRAAAGSFVASIEAELDEAAKLHPNPGRVAMHRLNRAEYTNAIRDLLALDIDSRSMLPADDSGYGFDNIADVLSVSPALLARYLSAATKITRLAVGDPAIRTSLETYMLSSRLRQQDRMSEDLPFGSRGGMAVRYNFPLDGDYVIKVALQRTHADQIRGVIRQNDLEVRLDHARIKQFSVGGEGSLNPWSPQPNPSEYERTADAGLEVRIPVKAGPRLVGVEFVKDGSMPEGLLAPRLSVSTYEFAGDREDEMRVYSVQIRGPYNAKVPNDTPSRRRIFVCYPTRSQDEDRCAKKVLAAFAERAYRRPITDRDLQEPLELYKTGRANGNFDGGIELALRSILISPYFLFRIERDPAQVAPGTTYPISDVELASRLSFFLWSSIPDEELLNLAERGKLKHPAVLAAQVKRMLRDGRSAALVNNFAGQWLYLRNMRSVTPDPDVFPDFDDNLREALERETQLFVESQVREDRSVVDLLTANYTFLNERLARHYGIAGVYGSHFRRVTYPADSPRSGLLGQGSILTATSYPARTAPTLRGKWVLQNLLGAPPPPAPPNVPALEATAEGKILSVRERMELHRSNPVCASCHARMDPIGFSLENFDGIGSWRATDGNHAIEASGVLPDGTKFEGVAGLRKILMSDRDQFTGALTDKLLTYALGRGTEYYDQPTIRQILREASPSDYRWSSVILAIVESTPFQMRRSELP